MTNDCICVGQTVLLMALFTELHGFDMDFDLLGKSSGYVRDTLVMASIGQYAEPEYLTKILIDAIQARNDDTASPPNRERTTDGLPSFEGDDTSPSTDHEYE